MRIEKALEILEKKKLECGLVLKPENIYYLTGFFPSSKAVLILRAEPLLLISKMDSTRAEEINIEYKIVEKFKPELKRLRYKKVGVEKNYISLQFFEKYLMGKKLKDLSLEKVRSVKDKKEIRRIRRAIRIAEDALSTIEFDGMTEKEIAASLEYAITRKADLAFKPIVASGRNSAKPHHEPTGKRVKEGEIVIVDLGAKVNHYNCDISRTYSTDGNKKFQEVYDAVLEAQEAAIAECYAKNKIKSADDAARAVLKEYGLEKLFLHSTGHGIGLEIHEEPSINRESKGKFKEGMVVTIEPGIYRGFGVRIEDMVLVGRTPKVLTKIKK
jgi:Xaa-Pro dipeptidase